MLHGRQLAHEGIVRRQVKVCAWVTRKARAPRGFPLRHMIFEPVLQGNNHLRGVLICIGLPSTYCATLLVLLVLSTWSAGETPSPFQLLGLYPTLWKQLQGLPR